MVDEGHADARSGWFRGDRPHEHQRIRVLAVDDEPVTLEILGNCLERTNCELLTARSGEDALRILQEQGADVVISDSRMPSMHGLELCRRIRNCDELGYIYFILITSFEDEVLITDAFAAGADDFVPKPFKPGEIIARMHATERSIKVHKRLASMHRDAQRNGAELALLNEKLVTRGGDR